MDYTEAGRIFADLRQTSHWPHLVDELVQAAVRYARLRVDWALAAEEDRAALEQTRTRAHDVLIDCCDILSRNMDRTGEDCRWRARLGSNRKEIGDFACHLHCLLGLSGR